MSSEKFCLRWNDFESNISSAFRDIRNEKEFFDITIACEDEQLQAHKVILSACSPFFKNVLRRNQHQHPLLYLKGVSFKDMEAVLNFMYHGEVNVAQDDLNSFLQVAEDLRVKGLTQNNGGSAAASTNEDKNHATVLKTEPRSDLIRPRHSDHDTPPVPKRPRPTPPVPPRITPQPVEQITDDIEVIVPVVKSEPRDSTPTVMATPMVQQQMEQEQTMAMYDDRSQQMQDTMMEQYDDNYGGEEYDGQYVDNQGYHDTNMIGTGSGQETGGAGSHSHIQCPHCDKSIHKASINRHIKTQHRSEANVQCQHCHGYYKNMDSLKYHLRQKHGVYQSK